MGRGAGSAQGIEVFSTNNSEQKGNFTGNLLKSKTWLGLMA